MSKFHFQIIVWERNILTLSLQKSLRLRIYATIFAIYNFILTKITINESVLITQNIKLLTRYSYDIMLTWPNLGTARQYLNRLGILVPLRLAKIQTTPRPNSLICHRNIPKWYDQVYMPAYGVYCRLINIGNAKCTTVSDYFFFDHSDNC